MEFAQVDDKQAVEKYSNEEPPANILNCDQDFDIEKWVVYTGLKVRDHKPEELEAFKKPFLIGWKRELSIRAQLHSSGKRIVDISYISPCNEVRLRSYIDLGVYLRNDQSCGLEPENFTFAKQPVYKYPEEMIKQLLKTVKHNRKSNSSNQQSQTPSNNETASSMPHLTPINDLNRSDSESNSLNSSYNNSLVEGRSRRKRTAPTRFDDEEYTEQVANKKKIFKPNTPLSGLTPRTVLSQSNSTSKSTLELLTSASMSPSSKMCKDLQSSSEEASSTKDADNTEELDKESASLVKSFKTHGHKEGAESILFNQKDMDSKDNDDMDSNFESKKDENSQDQLIAQSMTIRTPNTASSVNTATALTNKPKSSKRKSKSTAANNSHTNSDLTNSLLNNSLLVESLLQNGNFECEDNDLLDCELMVDTNAINDTNQMLPIPPCSLVCAGMKGDFPSLRCSRCLCLFHPACVRSGVFLKETKQFVCPNCVQTDDLQNAIEDSASLFEKGNDSLVENDQTASDSNSRNVNDSLNKTNNMKHKLPLKTSQQSAIAPMKHNSNNATPQHMKMPPKLANFVKHSKSEDLNNSHHQQSLMQHMKINGTENSLMQKKNKNFHLSNPNRNSQPQLMRNLMNQQHHQQNSSQRMKQQQAQMNISQMQQQFKQNNFHMELLNKLNRLATQQHSILNLKANTTQMANGSLSSSSLASRRTQLDTLNKSLASSQQLLESFKKLTALNQQLPGNGITAAMSSSALFSQNNPPNRSMKLESNNMRNNSHRDARELKYLNYLSRCQNGLKQMVDQNKTLDKIFDYLNVRDLIKFKQVNRTFNRLISERHHWKNLNLKGLIVKDWQYFAIEIINANQAEELNLEGLRLPAKTSSNMSDQDTNLEDDLWTSFKSCYKNFQSLTKISFGKISIQHLKHLFTEDDFTDKDSNPLYNLEELSIRNLYDESTPTGFFSLKLLTDKLVECKNLKVLRIESKQGISNDEATIAFLSCLAESFPELKSLYLPSLRGFSIENFDFLSKLTHLECLEIGSCESWTLGEVTLNDEGEQINTDDQLLESSENSNQENEYDNFDSHKRTTKKPLKQDAFKYLSSLRNLRKLYLTDVIIDEMSTHFPSVVEKMRNLESLALGSVTVSPDATQTLTVLCNTLNNKLPNLRTFAISTEDPHTNKCCFDLLLKRLDNLQELRWKVSTQVEDDGNCLVPFVKDRCDLESDLENEDNLDLTTVLSDCVEMVETCHLNEVLQRNLNTTKVYILPQ